MSATDAAAAMEWGECWIDPAPVPEPLATEVKRYTGGILPAWSRRLSSVPWVVRGFGRFLQKQLAYTPTELWDLIALVVSQDNSCLYCYGATRAILKTLGYDDAFIERIERDVTLADLAPETRTALQFARKLSQANPRPTDADFAALARAGFARPAVGEIAAMAAFMGFHNRISTSFALPPDPYARWMRNPLARLVRPFMARMFRGTRVAPVAMPANDGPCAEVVAALAGSPLAVLLRQTIDEAIASPVLPQRTKLLMLAVVGRALACDRAEREARAGLAGSGLSAGDVDQILANLGSPQLDAREALLLPFARDSVRYRNLAIQDRTRALGTRLTRDEVIEAVGIAALANVVARISVLLETC